MITWGDRIASQTLFSTGIWSRKLEVVARLVRVPYLLMLEISCILFMATFQRGIPSIYLMLLVSLVLLFIASGGFAINDYFDRESDAIVHPERPIPSNQISPLGVVQFSAAMFLAGFVVVLWINWLVLRLLHLVLFFLAQYSSFFKRLLGIRIHKQHSYWALDMNNTAL